MANIQYSIDDPGYPLMNGVRDLESLKHKTLREHWLPVDNRLLRENGCSLSEWIFYRHWTQDISVYELANELDESRQNLSALIRRLDMPVKTKGEAFATLRFREKLSVANKGKRLSKYTRRKISQHHIIGTRPPGRVLYAQYWGRNMSGYRIAEYWNVTHQTIYKWMEEEGISRKNHSQAMQGKPSWKKGKSYEKCYGKKEAKKIKDKMRDAWKRRRQAA